MKSRYVVKKIVFVKLIAVGIFFAALCFHSNAWAGVRIAVIDSGANGYVDSAISFTDHAGNEDPLNHGTEVAKLIRQGNPDATIYMLKVCEKRDGHLKPSKGAVLQAIRWAVEHDIDVVNMSLVVKYSSEIDRAVTEAVREHGIIFVAAAGNKNLSSHFATDSDGFIRKRTKAVAPAFPSSNPNVISVGGLDEQGKIAVYSDKLCDVYEDGRILGQEGSSFACARVTARIAKVLRGLPRATKEMLLASL